MATSTNNITTALTVITINGLTDIYSDQITSGSLSTGTITGDTLAAGNISTASLEVDTLSVATVTSPLTTFANNVRVLGSLSVVGGVTVTTVNTNISQQLEVVNNGTGPALYLRQNGINPIMNVYDDTNLCFEIRDGGAVIAPQLSCTNLSVASLAVGTIALTSLTLPWISATNVYADNLSAATGRLPLLSVTSLSATNASITNLGAASANIATLTTGEIAGPLSITGAAAASAIARVGCSVSDFGRLGLGTDGVNSWYIEKDTTGSLRFNKGAVGSGNNMFTVLSTGALVLQPSAPTLAYQMAYFYMGPISTAGFGNIEQSYIGPSFSNAGDESWQFRYTRNGVADALPIARFTRTGVVLRQFTSMANGMTVGNTAVFEATIPKVQFYTPGNQLRFRHMNTGNFFDFNIAQPTGGSYLLTFPDPSGASRTVLYSDMGQAATLGVLTISSLVVNGAATASTLTVSAATMSTLTIRNSLTTSTLTVNGAATASTLTVSAATLSTLTIQDTLTTSTLTVNGGATASTLTVSAATLSTLTVRDSATVSTLTVNGSGSFNDRIYSNYSAASQMVFTPGTAASTSIRVEGPAGGVNRQIQFIDPGAANRVVLYTDASQAATLGTLTSGVHTIATTAATPQMTIPGSGLANATQELWFGQDSGGETQWRLLGANSTYGSNWRVRQVTGGVTTDRLLVTSGGVRVNNNLAIGTNLTANALEVVGTTNLQGLTCTTLTATGNTTVGGTLLVAGATSLATLSTTNTTIGGTLRVTGATSLTTLSTTNTTIGGTLSVSGVATMASVSCTSLACTGFSCSSNAAVTGSVAVTGNLTVSGDTQFGSSLANLETINSSVRQALTEDTTQAGIPRTFAGINWAKNMNTSWGSGEDYIVCVIPIDSKMFVGNLNYTYITVTGGTLPSVGDVIRCSSLVGLTVTVTSVVGSVVNFSGALQVPTSGLTFSNDTQQPWDDWCRIGGMLNLFMTMRRYNTGEHGIYRATVSMNYLTANTLSAAAQQDSDNVGMPGTFNGAFNSFRVYQPTTLPTAFWVVFTHGVTLPNDLGCLINATLVAPSRTTGNPYWIKTNSLVGTSTTVVTTY